MKCPEKERLQHQCTAAWDLYVTETTATGIPVDTRSGVPMPPTISGLVAQKFYVDPKSGIVPAAYSMAIWLRGKYLAASMELSRHLARHRC